MNILTNARLPREAFLSYKERRANVNRQIKAYLRHGVMRHVSSEIVILDAPGVNEQTDELIRRREYRDVTPVFMNDLTPARKARTKGEVFYHKSKKELPNDKRSERRAVWPTKARPWSAGL